MQQAQLASASTEFLAQPTADFCDANPDAQVLQGRYESFGAVSRCAGRVETVSTRDDNSQVKAVLGEPGDGRVLFVDNSASLNCAMLGGDLAQLAARSGWAGIIINGAVRDVDELRETQIAVFALGTCPRKSIKRGFGSRSNPVRVAGTYIQPNDIIAADSDGVVILASWATNRPDV
ncbi:MAG: ribonuclease E activity regulator RraA [Woeseiaceae bacterium]|jgi:regulator of ribonuclease activity A